MRQICASNFYSIIIKGLHRVPAVAHQSAPGMASNRCGEEIPSVRNRLDETPSSLHRLQLRRYLPAVVTVLCPG